MWAHELDQGMTEVQKEKFDAVNELAGEHFDSHILIVLSKDDDGTSCLHARFSGGYYTVIGLLRDTLRDLGRDENED